MKDIESTERMNFRGNPPYPKKDDSDIQSNEVSEIDPEDNSKTKEEIERDEIQDEDDFDDGDPAKDLDIPGSELDDVQESIGSEDEENNFYSIGGDNHDD